MNLCRERRTSSCSAVKSIFGILVIPGLSRECTNPESRSDSFKLQVPIRLFEARKAVSQPHLAAGEIHHHLFRPASDRTPLHLTINALEFYAAHKTRPTKDL